MAYYSTNALSSYLAHENAARSSCASMLSGTDIACIFNADSSCNCMAMVQAGMQRTMQSMRIT